MQKQGFSTVDTHGPAIATTLFLFSHIGICTASHCILDTQPHRNRVFPGGRRQEALRLLLPGLLCVKSANSLSGMMQNKRCTSIMIVCHQRAFIIQIHWDKWAREGRKRWRDESMVGVDGDSASWELIALMLCKETLTREMMPALIPSGVTQTIASGRFCYNLLYSPSNMRSASAPAFNRICFIPRHSPVLTL